MTFGRCKKWMVRVNIVLKFGITLVKNCIFGRHNYIYWLQSLTTFGLLTYFAIVCLSKMISNYFNLAEKAAILDFINNALSKVPTMHCLDALSKVHHYVGLTRKPHGRHQNREFAFILYNIISIYYLTLNR